MKKLKIKYRKLGREKSWGLSHGGLIEIDITLKGKKLLETMLHECLHELFPKLKEEDVIEKSVILTNTLWHQRYRRIEPDVDIALQDGSK